MFNQFLEKQTVFLTGAAKGIGFSVMQHLLEAGARVVATDIDEVRLKTDSDALKNRYREQLFCYHLDLSQPESVARRVAQMIEQHGQFDHLVCCAGVLHLGSIASMPLAQIEHTFNVNTFGTLAVMQALAEGMKARRSGSMVIVGSMRPIHLVQIWGLMGHLRRRCTCWLNRWEWSWRNMEYAAILSAPVQHAQTCRCNCGRKNTVNLKSLQGI